MNPTKWLRAFRILQIAVRNLKDQYGLSDPEMISMFLVMVQQWKKPLDQDSTNLKKAVKQ
jgi:hypothetical protein